MPLDVYPNERYLEIVKTLPVEVLRAACRVAGVHIHLECFSLADALAVYAKLHHGLPKLMDLGDRSRGERLSLYRLVAPNCDPPELNTPEDLYHLARRDGWASNLRNWWSLLRITRYGTVEVRVFDATDDIERVCLYAQSVQAVAR